ncbi:deaminase [Mycobacterium gordonae]|uniref:Deaminase n=1 Tax=Mycobacterium gordonae TaxID=1778 RepID=A0A0Q2MMG0_MYCGO|nr:MULTISPECIES: dihydrofolate reductase family protein [Mycobacterium]KQH80879.1 deaminase [Mycobacterium gordonae]MDP7726608.1 dihydrofolate reductase family protein [Mycobacterium sp. TY813]
MGTLTYTASVSLDGYVADATGDFQWSAPGDPVFSAHIERMATVSTEVLGRKTYALMQYWETFPDDDDHPAADREFARRWRDIEKVVVSSTLRRDELGSERDRLMPRLSLDELKQIVDGAPGVVEIFGPTVAGPAIAAGMVEEFHFFVIPKMVGGGLRALPDGVHLDLNLVEHRIFGDGAAYLRYRAGEGAAPAMD